MDKVFVYADDDRLMFTIDTSDGVLAVVPKAALEALYAAWRTSWYEVGHMDPGPDHPGYSVIRNDELLVLDEANRKVEDHERDIRAALGIPPMVPIEGPDA